MQDSRRIGVDNGVRYIFWGLWVTAAALVAYFSAVEKLGLGGYIWGIAIPLGWLIDWLLTRRNQSRSEPRTLAGRVLTAVWVACGVAMSLVGFVGGMTVVGKGVTGVLSIITGLGLFVSGVVSDSWWLRYYAAFGWWIGGVVMFFFPGTHVFLLLAAEMLLFQFVPGIVVYRQWKREQSS
jgi:hypothetical protein